MMFDDLIIPSMEVIAYNRRLSIMIIFLTSVAVLLVAVSVAAFIYITRKEKVLRRSHVISVIIIILVELAFLIAVVSCSSIQSKNSQGQILAPILIVLSLLALMTLIYFLLANILKERIEPDLNDSVPFKSFTVQDCRVVSQHESPIPPPRPSSPPPPPPPPPTTTTTTTAAVHADDTAIPIATPPVFESFPRLPTPPIPYGSPPPEKPISVLPEKPSTPGSEQPASPRPEQNIPQYTESSSPYVVNYKKIRQDLLAAIEERTIPALEEAIQQVKDYDYIQPLKYECERALELLNRLMKIEHMKIKVLRLNQSTIAELHSYTKPPDEVLTVMRATFLLLGHSEREIQDWPQIQTLLGRFGKDSLRRRCYELNPLRISVDKAREAKDILRNYDLLRVTEISVGLSAFFNWSMTMVEEREKLLESQRRIVR